MIGFVIRVVATSLGIWLATRIVPGVEISSTKSLVLAATLLGIVNAIVRPVLVFLTFPITIVTLGLFLLVINGLMIKLVTVFLHGFIVHGMISAILCALVISLAHCVFSLVVGSPERI